MDTTKWTKMITRIKYKKILKNHYSYSIPLSATLTVKIMIDQEFRMSVMNVTGDWITMYHEKCTSLQMAKRKARKKLQDFGLNFNNEIRRKK